MSVDSLEQPQHHPNVDIDDVQGLQWEAVGERAQIVASTKDENLKDEYIYQQAELCRVFVVGLMNMLYKIPAWDCGGTILLGCKMWLQICLLLHWILLKRKLSVLEGFQLSKMGILSSFCSIKKLLHALKWGETTKICWNFDV